MSSSRTIIFRILCILFPKIQRVSSRQQQQPTSQKLLTNGCLPFQGSFSHSAISHRFLFRRSATASVFGLQPPARSGLRHGLLATFGGVCWRIADINIFVSLCCPSGNVCVLYHFGNIFPGFLFRTSVPYIKETSFWPCLRHGSLACSLPITSSIGHSLLGALPPNPPLLIINSQNYFQILSTIFYLQLKYSILQLIYI